MATINNQYVLSGESRVFIREHTECCPEDYSYHSCMRLDGIEQNKGEITSGYCPNPTINGAFIEVVTIRGAEERATTSLIGRIPAKYESVLYRLNKRDCRFDLQLHHGFCTNPTEFANYSFALIMEDIYITTYSTDPLGALTPDENALVNETVALSVGNYYYIRRMSIKNMFTSNPAVFTGFQGVDVVFCNASGCKNCCVDDCTMFILAREIASNTLWVFGSKDGGVTWTGSATGVVVGINNVGEGYNIFCGLNGELFFTTNEFVLVNQDFGVLYQSTIDGVFDGTAVWTVAWQVLNGTNTRFAGRPVFFNGELYSIISADGSIGSGFQRRVIRIALDGSNSFVVVYNPNRYNNSDYPSTDNLLIFNDEVMTVGVTYETLPGIGYMGFTYDGYTWEESDIIVNNVPVTNVQISRIVPISQTSWLAYLQMATGSPRLYCTNDGGVTWTFTKQMAHNYVAHVPITNNVMYAVFTDANARRKLTRSIDGGLTFEILPDNGTVSTYSATVSISAGFLRVKRPATCGDDINRVYIASTSGILEFRSS